MTAQTDFVSRLGEDFFLVFAFASFSTNISVVQFSALSHYYWLIS